jgi:hypothetical protein
MIKSHVLYRLSYGLTCVISIAYANAVCPVPISTLEKIPSTPASGLQ